MAEVVAKSKPKIRSAVKAASAPVRTGVRTAADWAKKKAAQPLEYSVTPDGDLTTPDGDVIPIQPYVRASPEVIKERYNARRAEIAVAQDEFTIARRQLNAILSDYVLGKATAADVVIANQRVHDTDCVISQRASGPQFIEIPGRLMGRDLNFNVYDTATIVEPVVQECYTTFAWQMLMEEKKVGEAIIPEEAPEAEEEIPAAPKSSSARIGAIIAANRAKKAAGF